MPDRPKIPLPDDSIGFFESLKIHTEKRWINTFPSKALYGFQVQHASTWKPGLGETDMAAFEKAMGFEFPDSLNNFYKVMNGLTLPGINIYGSSGHEPAYRPLVYSFPVDLPLIGEMIAWIYETNNMNSDILKKEQISRIFPIFSHRFMLIDVPGNPVLSMHGSDIIYWADNISKCLANELIDDIWNVPDFENVRTQQASIKFWLE